MYSPRLFFRDWFIRIPLIAIVVSEVFMWSYSGIKINAGAGIIFLHYNSIFGVDLVGEWWKIFYAPIFSFIIFVVNYGAALAIYTSEKFLARTLVVSAALYHLFLLVLLWLLVGINI